jgi:hypothetical protein
MPVNVGENLRHNLRFFLSPRFADRPGTLIDRPSFCAK